MPGRPALPITKPRGTEAMIAHLEVQGAARRDAVPGDSSRPRRKERRRTQAEAQEAGAGGQCDRKLRRGLEEEGGVCRGGSNGRERGGGRSGHVTRIV
jgi:hypothetical protein